MDNMDDDDGQPKQVTGDEDRDTDGAQNGPRPNGQNDDGPLDDETDPFDPERLRKAYAGPEVVGVKRDIIRIPVKKPDKYWFIRTYPDRDWWLEVGTLELPEEREIYLIAPHVYDFLRAYGAVKRVLIPSITRNGVLFVWPIRRPDEDGRTNPWSESALEIAVMAIEEWVSPSSNREAGCYEVIRAAAELDAPKWPDLSLHQIIKRAFKDRQIDSEDHPVVRRILGKA